MTGENPPHAMSFESVVSGFADGDEMSHRLSGARCLRDRTTVPSSSWSRKPWHYSVSVPGELLTVEPVVIAASLSTIALHHVEHAESSFELGYPLLEGYFLGENPLPFPRLDFFTKGEIEELLDLEQQAIL